MRLTDLKDRVRHTFSNVAFFIFPAIGYTIFKNKIIKRINKIDNDEALEADFQYVGSIEGYKLEVIQNYFNKTLDVKKSLEEKSRAIILSIVFSASVIFGLLTIIFGQSFTEIDGKIRLAIIIIGLYTIINMVAGAVLALTMLSGKIQIYQLYPEDEKNITEDKKCRMLALFTEQNANMNLIRNNNIYASYTSIVWSLISLCLLFILLCYTAFSKHDIITVKQPNNQQVIDQIKSTQISINGIYNNIESSKQIRESENAQLISVFSKLIDAIDRVEKQLEDLSKKHLESQLLKNKTKKAKKSPK